MIKYTDSGKKKKDLQEKNANKYKLSRGQTWVSSMSSLVSFDKFLTLEYPNNG